MKKARKGHNRSYDMRFVRLQQNHCFVCGKDNPGGMHFKWALDEDRKRSFCQVRLSKRFTGPPGYCHGGIIATLMDEAMAKINRLRQVTAATVEIKVNYLRPVPLHKPVRIEGWEVRSHGRRHFRKAEISNEQGEVLAQGHGVFVAVDPRKVFARSGR